MTTATATATPTKRRGPTMTRREAIKEIYSRGSRTFSIKFRKRTTDETRKMVARRNVTKYLAKNPSKPGVDFAANFLLGVYDMHEAKRLPEAERHKAYRSIPIEGITHLKVKGKWVRIEDEVP